MSNGNGNVKSTNDINQEIDAQRAHLSATIEALEHKLSPGQLFDQVLKYGKANGGQFSQNLVNTVRDNPIPTIMTALGIAWMMYGQNRPHHRSGSYELYDELDEYNEFDEYEEPYREPHSLGDEGYTTAPGATGATVGAGSYRAGEDDRDIRENIKEKTGNIQGSAKRAFHDARNRAEDAVHRASSKGHDSARRARHQAEKARHAMARQANRAQHSFEHLLEEQPLVVGAAGIAIGALIGASLPSSRTEDKMLGKYRDNAADKATEATEKAYDAAKAKGREIQQEAREKLDSKERTYPT